MQQVIIWAMVLMLCVFGIGLLSAIKSHRRRTPVRRVKVVVREQVEKAAEKNSNEENGLAMAMAGRGNEDVGDGYAALQAARR